jgi:hypothetical protein
MLFICVAPHTKSKGLPIGSFLLSKNYIFFTRIAPCTGSRSVFPYSVKTYAFYMRSTAYKKQGTPDRQSLTQQKFYIFYTHSTVYKKQGLSIGGPLLSKKFILFICVAPRTKSQGSRFAVPYSVKTYVFYTRSTAYKKQRALDRRSLTQ